MSIRGERGPGNTTHLHLPPQPAEPGVPECGSCYKPLMIFLFFSLTVKILPELSSWVENVPFPAILQLGWKAPGGPRRTPSEPSSPYQAPLGDQAPAFVPLKTSCRDPVPSKSWPGSRREGPGVHLETRFQEPYLVFPNMNPKGYPALQSVVQVIDRHANPGKKPSSPS